MSEKEAMEIYAGSGLAVDLSISRPPEVVLAEARKAAKALQDVISKKADPVIFGGQQYLEFEDWATCARFYGVTAKVRDTRFIQYGDVVGFEASADAILTSTGQAISSADAMCLNDEDKWSTRAKYEWQEVGGKRTKVKVGDVAVPLFQLRSMAQTRACAKALRNVFSWVVVLAGYRPTPAEEMPNGTKESAAAPDAPTDLITDAQRKRFFAKTKASSIPDDVIKSRLTSYHYGSTKEIKKLHYEALCEWADNFGKPGVPVTSGTAPATEANPGGDLPF